MKNMKKGKKKNWGRVALLTALLMFGTSMLTAFAEDAAGEDPGEDSAVQTVIEQLESIDSLQ